MKKIVILIACITLSLLLFSGCSEADLPESFKQSNTITRADASAVALSNIGVSKEDTTYTVVTENLNLEQPCYDVEILVDGVLYRYRIDASRGDLIKITVNNVEVAPEDVPKPVSSPEAKYISLEKVKQVAFADAGIAETDVLRLEYEMDYAHGKYLYDIEFSTATHEYEYEIDATDGSIFKKDIDGKTVLKPSATPDGDGAPAEYVTAAAAEDAALAHAQVERENAAFERTEWKQKKGAAVYKIEFISDGVEYEYTVNALTGAVISFESEGKKSNSQSEYIGVAAAKNAALAHAGLRSDEVKGLKAEPDVENGKTVYEVEFECKGYEYEYVVDAKTGEILDVEKERD